MYLYIDVYIYVYIYIYTHMYVHGNISPPILGPHGRGEELLRGEEEVRHDLEYWLLVVSLVVHYHYA